jgi:hypothetical protein
MGAGTRDQDVPFRCSISGAQSWLSGGQVPPTAQALLADDALTASRPFRSLAGLGTVIFVQAFPAQCRISVFSLRQYLFGH